LARTSWRASELGRRQLQHRLQSGAAEHLDELLDHHLPLLDQLHNRQQCLTVAAQESGQSLAVLLLDDLV